MSVSQAFILNNCITANEKSIKRNLLWSKSVNKMLTYLHSSHTFYFQTFKNIFLKSAVRTKSPNVFNPCESYWNLKINRIQTNRVTQWINSQRLGRMKHKIFMSIFFNFVCGLTEWQKIKIVMILLFKTYFIWDLYYGI